MTEEKMIKVMLVDDHPIVRAGLETILSSQPDIRVLAQAGSGEEAVAQARSLQPDIVLMDLRLPAMSGVEAIRQIRSACPRTKILVLTTYDGDEDIHQALRAGAASYIIKGMQYEVLLRAIRRVHGGSTFLPDGVSALLGERSPDDLSAREREVLSLMADGKSNRAIAEQLGVTERTVKCHVGAILAHLGVTDRTQAVLAALRRGYVHL